MNANLSNQDAKIDSSSNIWQQFPPCKQPVRQGINKSTPANPLIFNITIAKLCEIHNEAALLIRHWMSRKVYYYGKYKQFYSNTFLTG